MAIDNPTVIDMMKIYSMREMQHGMMPMLNFQMQIILNHFRGD